MQANTAHTAISEELKQVRKRQRDQDDAKLSKGVKKNENQRVWTIEQVMASNAEADEPIRIRKVEKDRSTYKIAIKLPWDAWNRLRIDE